MNTAACSVHLPSLSFISQRSLFTSSCVPIKERSLLSRGTHTTHMRLPPGSRALRRRRSGLPHSVLQRAPRDGTVGLRNPASRDPARERSDKVFGERSHATTGFFSNTDADDYFPNDDFFPDVDDLLGNMSSSANASGSSSAPYVLLVFLSDMMQYVLLFPICLDLFISSNLFRLVHFVLCGRSHV